MKRFSTLVLAVMVALTLTASLASAGTLMDIQKRGTLRIGLEPGYMPFELINQKGEIIGFDIDLGKRMAKAMGVKLEVISTPFDGIIPSLMTDKFDIIMAGMTLTQKRNLSINFATPYIVIGQSILVSNNVEGITSYKDLNDPKYTVASVIGTTGEQATKRMIPKAKYVSYEKQGEGVIEVVNGKIDAFVYDLPYQARAFVQRGNGKVYHLSTPFTYEPLAWGVRNGDYDFINWLNNFLHQVQSDGTYDKIYAKWFESDSWLKELQ